MLPEIWELKTENRELRLRLADAAPHAALAHDAVRAGAWSPFADRAPAPPRGAAGAARGAGAVDTGFLFGGADGSLSSGLFRRTDVSGGRGATKRSGDAGHGGPGASFPGEREADVRMQEMVASLRELEVCDTQMAGLA